MRKFVVVLSLFVLLWSVQKTASAQSTISVPSDAKFVMQLDLQALKSSKIGSVLMDAAKKAAMKEVGKKADSEEWSLSKINEVLGMNPFEEVQGIVLCASDYEKPDKSMLGMVRLKKNTGNIEGLLLSIPGYENSTYGKYEIHSAAPSDDKDRFFGAIHKNSGGNHTFIAGANKRAVTDLLDSLDAKADSSKTLKNVELESDRKMIVSLQLLELPSKDIVGKGPQANIAALLSSFVLSVFEEDDELEVRGSMKTTDEKQADKIRQSIQGLSAMVELFASLDEQDDETREMLKLIKQVKVTHEGTSVRVKLRLPSHQIAEMIKREIDN